MDAAANAGRNLIVSHSRLFVQTNHQPTMKLSLSLLLGAFAATASAQDATILETATAAGFGTLVAAVSAAGLSDTLNGDGPFTVFAPVNEAFGDIPEAVLNCLLEQSEPLSDILLAHVIAGQVLSTDLSDGLVASTVGEDELTFSVSDAGVTISFSDVGAVAVTSADVLASNGVIHIIDGGTFAPFASNRYMDVSTCYWLLAIDGS